MRRRRWLWIAILAVLCPVSMIPSLRRNPYGFLDQFHPKRIEFIAKGGNTTGDGYVLVFSKQYATSVLESMESHLIPEKDYSESHLRDSGMWIFPKGHTDIFEHGAAYATQGHERELLPNMANLPVVEPGGCIVMIDPEPTWASREWDPTKKRIGL